jgi:mRNA turnover protein 4
MPKSKRNKVYSMTNTRKKGLERKSSLLQEVRDCCDKYSSAFLFSVENMRNNKLKDIRTEWKHSRFFFGKNRIMQLALGRTEEEEYKEGIHTISNMLKGNVGLLFTNEQSDIVRGWFDQYHSLEYARSGFTTSQDILLKEGPLEQFSHSLEPHLRSLGLPTALKKGRIVLLQDHEVCKANDVLTPEQARLVVMTTLS